MLRYFFLKYSILFYKDELIIIYVVDLKIGKVVMMEIENIFFMYYVNVYELDDIIFVMDVVFYFDVLLISFFEMDILMNKI